MSVICLFVLLVGWKDLKQNELSKSYATVYVVLFASILAISGLLLVLIIPATVVFLIWFFVPSRQ